MKRYVGPSPKEERLFPWSLGRYGSILIHHLKLSALSFGIATEAWLSRHDWWNHCHWWLIQPPALLSSPEIRVCDWKFQPSHHKVGSPENQLPTVEGGSKSHLINIKKTPLSLSLLRKTQGALCQKWGIYCKSHEETDSSSYLMRGVPASLRRALEMEYVVVADCHKSALRSQKLTSFPNAEYTHSLLKIPSLTLLVASACI